MILLDTHTVVWLASDQDKLSVEAKKTISLHAWQLAKINLDLEEVKLL